MTQVAPSFFESEHAHEASAIEWWFIQGFYESAARRRHFMVTLFRFNLEQATGERSRNGFQLLVTVLDPTEGQAHRSLTQVDPEAVSEAASRLRSTKSKVDPAVREALAAELETCGPPHPIVVEQGQLRFNSEPFAVEWGEFEMGQHDNHFSLRFPEPDTGKVVSLVAETSVSPLSVQLGSSSAPIAESMAYRCYPRVRLTGQLDRSLHVQGEAWLDHQWGDIGWFWDSRNELLLGWDWFGINLDDGADLMVIQHRDAQSGAVLARNATVRNGPGVQQAITDLILTPLRYWESGITRIRYPVAWRIQIHSLAIDLTFSPLSDDQEVASFGELRAVWEGAGVVTGTVAGRPVRGRARGEFHGYGYIFDFHEYISALGARVDRCLEELLPRRFALADVEKFVGPALWKHEPAAYTETIAVPVWDLIDRSGKRWRPIFGLLLLEALGVDSRPYEGLVSAIGELMHAGSLIVDDIEDESPLRRGQESLHRRYGTDVALNAGNALYFLPAVALMNHPLLSPSQRLRFHELKEQVCIDAHCGQATDIYWSRNMSAQRLKAWLADDFERKILQMYDFKSAAGARGLAEACALIAGSSGEVTAACVAFARSFAVAFQVVDDVHSFSRSPRWTKVAGEDIANGKATYVIATALRRLSPCDADRLIAILSSPALRRQPATLEEAIALVRDSGVLGDCQEQARRMLADAWRQFSVHLEPTEHKIMLHAMCLNMIDLSYDS